MGHGALVFREKEKTAVMLQAPLTFTFKSKRTDEDPLRFVTQLVITGHFMVLVDRPHCTTPRWGLDKTCAYTKAHRLAYKGAVAAAVRALGAGVVSQRIIDHLAIL